MAHILQKLFRLLLVCGLILPLVSCIPATTVYIHILPREGTPIAEDFSRLDASVRTWPEFSLKNECQETADYRRNYFKGTDIYIWAGLNAETNTLVLVFSEYKTSFSEDAEKMIVEITNRLQAEFGQDRVVVRSDRKTGKYILEESFFGRHKSFPKCPD